ncbi:nucleotidyl transferase AbiEii/AbiGii toxin family protein [Candidatus Pacearchaeota archaeon]|nr:nucleotidyl transferase AbiEii/AbiGii toxin family protein [Candidatus Pacearchaeota archaeon]
MEIEIDLNKEFSRIGKKTNFSQLLIEKDYYLTKILHKISEKKINDLVFKGGTCLNKCYLGFYRLSEDLDFVFNQDVKNFSKSQVKKILDKLRRELFGILEELGMETNNELGKGWKMITSKKDPKILGLEIMAKYKSNIDNAFQTIKIEISFRNKLRNLTKEQPIHHEFINELGEPFLEENIKLEVIDLVENFAEKFRALITRENIAIRDIFDIYFILKKDTLNFDKETLELALIKINETLSYSYEPKDFEEFIENIHSKVDGVNEKELEAVLRSGEETKILEMIKLIKQKVLKSK